MLTLFVIKPTNLNSFKYQSFSCIRLKDNQFVPYCQFLPGTLVGRSEVVAQGNALRSLTSAGGRRNQWCLRHWGWYSSQLCRPHPRWCRNRRRGRRRQKRQDSAQKPKADKSPESRQRGLLVLKSVNVNRWADARFFHQVELGSTCWAREDRELSPIKRSFSSGLGIFFKVSILR